MNNGLFHTFAESVLMTGVGYMFCCLVITYAAFILFKELLLSRLEGDADRKKATAIGFWVAVFLFLLAFPYLLQVGLLLAGSLFDISWIMLMAGVPFWTFVGQSLFLVLVWTSLVVIIYHKLKPVNSTSDTVLLEKETWLSFLFASAVFVGFLSIFKLFLSS